MDQDEVRQGNAGKCAGGSILGKAGGSGQGGDFRRRSSKLRIHWRSKNGQYDGIHITFQHMPKCGITQEESKMKFRKAWKAMKKGHKVKRPFWKGYWAWENGTIMMHCRDGKVEDIRDTEHVAYTFDNVAAKDWEVVK